MLVAPQYEEFAYNRRVPEQELLHQVLVEHLETFLDRACTAEHSVPLYVEKELRDYVECGVLGCPRRHGVTPISAINEPKNLSKFPNFGFELSVEMRFRYRLFYLQA